MLYVYSCLASCTVPFRSLSRIYYKYPAIRWNSQASHTNIYVRTYVRMASVEALLQHLVNIRPHSWLSLLLHATQTDYVLPGACNARGVHV